MAGDETVGSLPYFVIITTPLPALDLRRVKVVYYI